MPTKPNIHALTRAIPLDELMTAVDITEDKLLLGRYSKARFSKEALYFEVEGHWIKTKLIVGGVPAGIKGPPQIDRHKIRWAVPPDADIEYRYLDVRLKEFITLKKSTPIAFSYEVDEGSHFQANPDGSISMYGGEDDEELLAISEPFAVDREGKKFELKYELNDGRLELTGDLSEAVYPVTIDPTYTVKTETESKSTQYNNARNLARRSDASLWCAYYRSDGFLDQIYCAYSADGGQNWTEEQLTDAADNQYSPAIAIDSEDNVHVTWYGLDWGDSPTDRNIQYRKRTTAWQAQEAITDVAFDPTSPSDQTYPSIAIDSEDNIHVTWQGLGWETHPNDSNIQYRKRTATAWQVQEAITDSSQLQGRPSIAIDSEDNIHVVWRGYGWGINAGEYNIQYRKRTTAWQAQEALTDATDDQGNAAIAIDSEGNVHVTWHGYSWGTHPDVYNVQYRKRTTAWQAQEALTDAAVTQYYPTIAIDSEDNVHVAWYGLGWGDNGGSYNIQYRKRTTAWQAQERITDRAFDNRHPSLIWAFHPTVSNQKTNHPKTGYALVWSGEVVTGYQVEYYASDDLGWEVAILTSNAATGINRTSARLNGTLEADLGVAWDVRFQWGVTEDYGHDTPWQTGFHTGDTFSQLVTTLVPNTFYHFRAQARSSLGLITGADIAFWTEKPSLGKAYALSKELHIKRATDILEKGSIAASAITTLADCIASDLLIVPSSLTLTVEASYDAAAIAGIKVHVRTSLTDYASGSHTGADGAAALTNAEAHFVDDELVGLTVKNLTDGSSGVITANTETGVTATLAGGTDNDWDSGDAYIIEGAGYDTEDWDSFTPAFNAGSSIRQTEHYDVDPVFLKVLVENLDAAQAVTDVKIIIAVGT